MSISSQTEAGRSLNGRERILDAALALFSRHGFAQTTTDRIAREAGVSQAYVVRSFGGKAGLIEAVCSRSLDRIVELFQNSRAATQDQQADFGERFRQIAFGGDDMRLFGQVFVCGHDEHLGKLGREGFLRVCRVVHEELGVGLEETRTFVAQGMLAMTLALLDYPQPADPLIDYLITGSEPN